MKNPPNNNIDWQAIQTQYNNSSRTCICFASETFSMLWKDDKICEQIRSLANEFLTETNQPTTIMVGRAWLFNYESVDQVRPIREQFLQWCIDNNK